MNVSRSTIFVFSLEPWGDMWYSKHHYAVELAKNHQVIFVSPPDRWRLSDFFSFRLTKHTTPEGVTVVEYRNNLPIRLLPRPMRAFMEQFTAWKFRRLLNPEGNIFWSFHPTTLVERSPLHRFGYRTIYHVVDPYQSFPDDLRTAKHADVVVAINPWFLDYSELNPNTVLIPHGVRAEDMEQSPERAEHYRRQWGRYAVMAAGINERTHYALLLALAERILELKLVLVGPLAPISGNQKDLRDQLLTLPNVVHLGVQHPDELRHIILGCVVGLVTYAFEVYQIKPLAASGTPLKVITYLAQQRPVVSSINSYIPELDRRGVFKPEDVDEFIEVVLKILDGGSRWIKTQ
ncbi:MAG: glycosyltransferase [Flavobacteriales bacterium]|nr:glycosyltransferase [Flavobacteriales bacterium]